MQLGTLAIVLLLCVFTSAGNVPSGFLPLPPLPVGVNTKQTPKPTLPPVTKKPVVTKPTVPQQTPPPPTLPSSTLPPPSTRRPTVFAPVTSAPSTSPNCGLNVNIPGTNCNNVNSAVQQALLTLKQELDKTRAQHQAQNVAVQGIITQLQSKQSGYLNKISDLQNEVANLVNAYNALVASKQQTQPTSAPGVTSVPALPTAGVSNVAFQQAIQAVNSDINKAVGDFNSRIFNLSSLMLTNEQQDVQVHQSIETQIQKQASAIGLLSQQVVDLENILRQINSTGGGGSVGSGATAADVARLQTQINRVGTDIQQYDQNQQSQFTNLNLKTASLLTDVNNHTSELRSLRFNLFLDQSRIRDVEKNITVVHDALVQFRQQTIPQMTQMSSDVGTLKTDVSTVKTRATSIDQSVLRLITRLSNDESSLNGLNVQVSQLRKDVTAINNDLRQQTQELTGIKNGMVNLKNAIPVSALNTMNNIILQVLSNPSGNITSQQLQSLSAAITTITNKLGFLNPPNASG